MSNKTRNDSLPIEARFGAIENRNFLSPVGFKFQIGKMPGVDFYCQSASIPAISMGTADQPTRLNNIYQPGDELYYEPLFVKFLIDENMKNYYQVHDWIRRICTPVASQEFTYNTQDDGVDDRVPYAPRDIHDYPKWGDNQWKSDCSLFILSSNYQPVSEFVFRDCIPVSLTTINFDSSVSDVNYFTAEVSFRYNYFDYFIYDAAEATDETMKPTYRKSYVNTLINNLQN
jgi:hypothetical protein